MPLAVAGPGLSPGERHDDASLADVAPTLLHAAGLRESRPSLASSPSTGKITTAWGTLYGPPLASARQGNERVIVGNDEELRFRSSEYGIDEALPPAEDPLAAAARAIRGPASGEPVEREELRGLQALGYVE
ncbi:MAG: hypothetical protein GY884_33905 [Proteobacteria bacterium]|nr:hypothetical protein [Pseudomonadota bacterium]